MSEAEATQSRPRLEARRRAFLDAGSAVFLDKGYANATLDDVIARSGGSRQTLYALFGGKQGLFEAIVAERSKAIFVPFANQHLLDQDPEEVLLDLGIHYLETVTSPDVLGLYRLVVGECAAMREVAQRFWDTGPGRSRALLAEYFKQLSERGVLHLSDPERASHQFWGLLLGSFQLRCLLGVSAAPEAAEIRDFVSTAVARFLDGCRTRPATPASPSATEAPRSAG